MSQTLTERLKAIIRKVIPKFSLITLFALVAIVGVFLSAVESHKRAQAKIKLADRHIQKAIKEVRETVYSEAAAEFERNLAGRDPNWDNANVNDRKKLYRYLKDSVTQESQS